MSWLSGVLGDCGCRCDQGPARAVLLGGSGMGADQVDRLDTVRGDAVGLYRSPGASAGAEVAYLRRGQRVNTAPSETPGWTLVHLPAGTHVYAWRGATSEGGAGLVDAGPLAESDDYFARTSQIFPSSPPAPAAKPAEEDVAVVEEGDTGTGALVAAAVVAAGALLLGRKKRVRRGKHRILGGQRVARRRR